MGRKINIMNRARYKNKLYLLTTTALTATCTNAIWIGRIEDLNPLFHLARDNSNAISSVSCDPGFIMDPSTRSCIDIDECRTQHICSSNQQCNNTPGSYTCTCKPGYQRSSSSTRANHNSCVDIDECKISSASLSSSSSNNSSISSSSSAQHLSSLSSTASKCPASKNCVNTDGSFYCACSEGYKALGDQCVDVNECRMRTHGCPENSRCLNSNGSFKCLCNHGYKMTEENMCVDIDECVERRACSGLGEVCHNTEPGFECTCKEGYQRLYDRYCVDIDECKQESACPEHSTCRNWYGGFSCICDQGYEKDENGICIKPDVCAQAQCRHKCSLDEATNQASCYCPKGYRTMGNNCYDVNECDRHLDSCTSNTTCVNLYGDYKCLENPRCPENYQLVPDYRDFANYYVENRRSKRRSRSRFSHICLLTDAVRLTNYEDSYYYDDYEERDESNAPVNAIYWHYIGLKSRVRSNTKVMRIDLSHRRQSKRGVTYNFKVLDNENSRDPDADLFKVIQRGKHRRPRAMVRVKKGVMKPIRGPRTYTLTIQMSVQDADSTILDTILIESTIFVSKWHY